MGFFLKKKNFCFIKKIKKNLKRHEYLTRFPSLWWPLRSHDTRIVLYRTYRLDLGDVCAMIFSRRCAADGATSRIMKPLTMTQQNICTADESASNRAVRTREIRPLTTLHPGAALHVAQPVGMSTSPIRIFTIYIISLITCA